MITDILTRQQYRIAKLVAEELAEKQIADRLHIAESTVHTHTRRIRKKLGVKTAVGIAVKYLQSLEEPKKFVLSILFLTLQSLLIFSVDEIDMRRNRIARRVVRSKTVRLI